MHTSRRRAGALLLALVVLLTLAVAPADGLTIQRKWSAKVGSTTSGGTTSLRAYTTGTGAITYGLKGLRKNVTYTVQIRYGTCSRLGSLATTLPGVRTSSTGTVAKTTSLLRGHMYWVWKAARSPSFVVRLVNGTSIRCGTFSFAHATRVWVSGLGIDLPVVRGPSGYPYCGVAMYHAGVAQPREPGITYIYAHARTGMFLPLLSRWRADRGASLIGRTVKVWTSDSYVISYRINKVRVTSDAMAGATTLTRERLWLQTSTGPNTSYPKLIVEASRISTVRTTYAASHPAAHPRTC
jgi:hypothetical protein